MVSFLFYVLSEMFSVSWIVTQTENEQSLLLEIGMLN